ncbi:phage portal protein [Lysobacter soli]|uniref:phage portal protein n=1 Tax=Lysobacter soli TaxID=453783 RepID=UPI0037CA1CB9
MTGSAAAGLARLSAIVAADRAVALVEGRAESTQPVMARVHEAVRPSRGRRIAPDYGSGNSVVGQDARTLRDQARRLERDHDISRNALNVLVQNTVGSGIDVIPAPRISGQPVDRELAQQLRDLWDDWWDRPEVTWTHDFGKCQDLIARSWYRDGEALFQALAGPVPLLDHGTMVPFSIEMLEADLLPLDFNDSARGILQGIERNAWGRRTAYHLYKRHPGDPDSFSTETKRVPAEFVHHIALIDRIHQVRGLSVFASVIARLEDIKDYEDSERIAAKVAASLCAQIIKGQPEMYGAGDNMATAAVVESGQAYRALTMRPGLIADDLLPGERVEVIDSKRPNPNTETFRTGQLRAAAGGFGTSYSSLSLDYNGSYSSQRQELVEKWGGYHKAGEFYIAQVVRPIWRRFVEAAVLSGRVRVPKGWTLRQLAAATYVRPVMPWIDPKKEADARAMQEDRRWVAPQKNVLELGSDPNDVLQQSAEWQAQLNEHGLQIPTQAPEAPLPIPEETE